MLGARIKRQDYLVWLPLVTAIVLWATLTFGGLVSYGQRAADQTQVFNVAAFAQVTLSRAITTSAYLILCAVYLFWLIQPQRYGLQSIDRFRSLLKPAIPFLLLAWTAYPLSNDIYLYLQYGFMKLLGANPYLTPAGDVTTALTPLLDWSQTATYGPISLSVFAVSAAAVADHPILSVYLFKLFCAVIYVLNAYLVWLFLQSSPARNKLTIAYLLNPYLMIAQVADAHIDVLLSTSIILSIGCLYHRRYTAAILTLVAGVFTKTLPILWLPLVVNYLVRRQQWQKLALSAVACLMIGIGLSRTILPGWAAWKSLLNPGASGMTARSLHHLFRLLLTHSGAIDWDAAGAMVQPLATVTLLGFGLFYLWTLFKPYRQPNYSELNLVQDIGWVTLVLLLFATPWLMPWYASALLSIAVLTLDAPLFCIASMTFALCSGLIFGAGSGESFISIFAALLTVFPTIAVLIFRDRVLQFCRPVVDRLSLVQLRSRPAPLLEEPVTSSR